MPVSRIFMCYKAKDANFATKIINDLHDSGAEIITDSTDLSDAALEHLLTKELPGCQQLIIIQTPSAVRSSHVQTIVSTALKYVQQGKMERVIRVIAPTLNGGDPQVVPLMWTKIPTCDASQDYPSALERLRLTLGLSNITVAYDAPLPAPHVLSVSAHDLKEDSGQLSVLALPYSQYPDSLDHPQKYISGKFPSVPPASFDRPRQPMKHSRISPRLWLIISSIAIALLISTVSVAAFVHQASKSVKSTPLPKTSIAVIPTLAPTPTSTPTPLPTVPATPAGILTWATSGQPFINDRLQSQNGNNWSVNTTGPNQCQFTGGSYHASVSSSYSYALCLALADQDSNLQNIALQVQVTITKGDVGGLIFRSDASGSNNYSFTICINPACGPGYGLYRGEGGHYSRIASDPSAAIKTGLNQTNLLTVVDLNGSIYLYINNVNVAHVNDNTNPSGNIGLMAYEASNPTEVTFSNAQVWKLQG